MFPWLSGEVDRVFSRHQGCILRDKGWGRVQDMANLAEVILLGSDFEPEGSLAYAVQSLTMGYVSPSNFYKIKRIKSFHGYAKL